MQTRYKYKFRPLWALLLLLLTGNSNLWGQEQWKITPHTHTANEHIPIIERTFYVPEGATREWYLREIYSHSGLYGKGSYDDMNYIWYRRWYRMDTNGNVIELSSNLKKPTGSTLKNGIIGSGNSTNAWFWIIDLETDDAIRKENSKNASIIQYTMPSGGQEDVIYCDVSINGNYTFNEGNQTLKEPTVSARYKYIIKPASQAPLKNNYPTEKYTIEAPKGDTLVNIQMNMLPVDYYWKDGSTIYPAPPSDKILKIDTREFDATVKKLNDEPVSGATATYVSESGGSSVIMVHFSGGFQQPVKVEVKLKDVKNCPVLGEFIIKPQENSGFVLEENIKENDELRHPENFPNLYDLVGSFDFDFNETVGQLTQVNNARTIPMTPEQTTYAFCYPDAVHKSKSFKVNPLQNQYGLYRSAQVEDISTSDATGGIEIEEGVPPYKWFFNKDVGEVYDRTYERTKNTYGYFYYIDASLERGRIVNVPIEMLCARTELVVTAWVNNMTSTTAETVPHLLINLLGHKQNGEYDVLHQFVSGDTYIDSNASTTANASLTKWQQLAYKCVIDLSDYTTSYQSYSVEILNNAENSGGNDFAIDDIRIYKTLPNIQAVQTDFCEINTGEGSSNTAEIKSYIRVRTPFDLLLRNLGLEEMTGNPILTSSEDSKKLHDNTEYRHGEHPRHYHMYYSVATQIHGEWQYLNLDYHNNPDKSGYLEDYQDDDIRYGTSVISANFDDMPTSGKDLKRKDALAWTEIEDEVRYIVFDSIPIHPHRYEIVDGSGNGTGTYAWYDTLHLGTEYHIQVYPHTGDPHTRPLPDDPCALATSFKVHKSLELMYGDIPLEDAVVLQPGKTITGVFRYYNESTLTWEEVDSPNFYWYYGPVTTERSVEVIQEILLGGFDKINEITGGLTDEEKKYLKNGPSFEIPTEGELIHQLIVVPKEDILDNEKLTNVKACTTGRVLTFDPILEPGDPEVDYPDPDDPDPDDPGDDPDDPNPDPDPKDPNDPEPDEDPDHPGRYVRSVRIMLEQIQDMIKNVDGKKGTLRIPIHSRATSDGRKFVLDPNNTAIRLVRTSDRVAHDLNHKLEETNRIQIGTLESLVLRNSDQYPLTWDTDYFTISFEPAITDGDKNNIEFREGFWYMVEVPFMEVPNGYSAATTLESEIYRGEFKLTFKIVPKYVTWIGTDAKMHNWNNDGPKHWRRSTNDELYFADNGNGSTPNAEANGTHTEAYTPMRFTNVTVSPKSKVYDAYPYLYKLENKAQSIGNIVLLDLSPIGLSNEIGLPTTAIEFDLVADPDWQKILKTGTKFTNSDHNYACVRFYGNECNEIYFKPNAAMLHTEYLTYNKAWVDYELDANRWYTLASPLKGIVAGDMYLPTSARQETPAFTDIRYDETGGTRWNPAVYMRGWNKSGEETVIVKEGTGNKYAISGSWSNLYNKVSEPFAAGTGFSIGVDYDQSSATANKVLFRLPKADVSYLYYENTTNTTGGNSDPLTGFVENSQRVDYARLVTDGLSSNGISSSTTVSVDYQLVGNPFMSHLDMTKYFENSDGSYYILTDEGIQSHILGQNFVLSTGSNNASAKKVAPLQSFITNKVRNITSEMMIVPYDGTVTTELRSASVQETLPEIRISTEKDGVKNTAVVAYYGTASEGYAPNEDAVLFIDKQINIPQIYTVAGNKLTAINVTPELNDVPLGIYSADNSPVELRFSVSASMGNVSLFDNYTKKSYTLTDGMTISVAGNTSGRYFLRGTMATSNELVAKKEALCYSGAPGRIDVIHSESLRQVAIYSLNGQRVRFLDNLNTSVLTLDGFASGLYIVRMEGPNGVCTEKVEVK